MWHLGPWHRKFSLCWKLELQTVLCFAWVGGGAGKCRWKNAVWAERALSGLRGSWGGQEAWTLGIKIFEHLFYPRELHHTEVMRVRLSDLIMMTWTRTSSLLLLSQNLCFWINHLPSSIGWFLPKIYLCSPVLKCWMGSRNIEIPDWLQSRCGL